MIFARIHAEVTAKWLFLLLIRAILQRNRFSHLFSIANWKCQRQLISLTRDYLSFVSKLNGILIRGQKNVQRKLSPLEILRILFFFIFWWYICNSLQRDKKFYVERCQKWHHPARSIGDQFASTWKTMRSRKEKNDWTIGLSFLLASHVSPYFLHSPEGTAIIHSGIFQYYLINISALDSNQLIRSKWKIFDSHFRSRAVHPG